MMKKSPSESSLRAIEPRSDQAENGCPEMSAKENAFKPTLTSSLAEGKRERAFELSLPAVVTGIDSTGKRFREKTCLISISSAEATLWMKTNVTPGTRVEISLDIPKTLILENHLKLHLSGNVIAVRSETGHNGKKQVVSLSLERRFKLLAIPINVN